MSLNFSCNSLDKLYQKIEIIVNSKLNDFAQLFENKINSLHDDISNMQEHFDDCFDVLHGEVSSRYLQLEEKIDLLQTNVNQDLIDDNFEKLYSEISCRQEYLVDIIETLRADVRNIPGKGHKFEKHQDIDNINSHKNEINENLSYITLKVKSLEEKVDTLKMNLMPLSEYIIESGKNPALSNTEDKSTNCSRPNSIKLLEDRTASTHDRKNPGNHKPLNKVEMSIDNENCLVMEFRNYKEIDNNIVLQTCSKILERKAEITSQETLYEKDDLTAIKFCCRNLNDKIDLLRNKSKLKGTNCFIRKFDSPKERRTKLNLIKMIKSSWKAEKVSVKDKVVFVDGERFSWQPIECFKLINVKPEFLYNSKFCLPDDSGVFNEI